MAFAGNINLETCPSANVAFADGHVSKLMLPAKASANDIRDLTTWLCQGDIVTFNGETYERPDSNKADATTKH